MSKRNVTLLPGLSVALAAALMVGCGSNGGPGPPAPTPPGSVVVFGTDAPVCDVESFLVTITSANLVPHAGGQLVPVVISAAPATVDFARLADFTNILSIASVPPGNYNQLWITLTSPQLLVLNTSTSPPTPQTIPVTLMNTSLTIQISPDLVVSASTTSGLVIDFNLRQSLQVQGGTGQVTGTVIPQITIAPTTPSGSTAGEATGLIGIIQSVSTTNLPSGITGSFGLALQDGTGQTLTILTNSNTVFEGDGVTSFSNLAVNAFVEVDAIINTSGQIIAQTVDSEEQTSANSLTAAALLGKVISVTRDGSGNATAFTMIIGTEDPFPTYDAGQGDSVDVFPPEEPLTVALTTNTKYFTNWRQWNQQSFTFGPKTLGLAESVAVFGSFSSPLAPPFTANQIFLRPRSVLGNFKTLQAAGSDNLTGGFTMTPCGGLFGGQAITVLTYPDSVSNGLSGLTALTPTPTLNTVGLLFYQQTSGRASTGGSWTAPTWVMQARQVHQLPN